MYQSLIFKYKYDGFELSLYLDSVLYRVVSWQLAELRVSAVIDTQVQVFVEHPEIFVGSLHQPVPTLTEE